MEAPQEIERLGVAPEGAQALGRGAAGGGAVLGARFRARIDADLASKHAEHGRLDAGRPRASIGPSDAPAGGREGLDDSLGLAGELDSIKEGGLQRGLLSRSRCAAPRPYRSWSASPRRRKRGELAPSSAGLDQLAASIDQLAATGDDGSGLSCARPCYAAASSSPVMVPGTRGVIVSAR